MQKSQIFNVLRL